MAETCRQSTMGSYRAVPEGGVMEGGCVREGV